jgi:hypothetical protein
MTLFPSLVYGNGMYKAKFCLSSVQHTPQKIMRRSRKCKVPSVGRVGVLYLVEESIQKQDQATRNTTTGHLRITQGRQVAPIGMATARQFRWHCVENLTLPSVTWPRRILSEVKECDISASIKTTGVLHVSGNIRREQSASSADNTVLCKNYFSYSLELWCSDTSE